MAKSIEISDFTNLTHEPVTITRIPEFLKTDKFFYYEANDTPKDHMPPEFTHEDILKGIQRGDRIEFLVDANGLIIAYLWFEYKINDDQLYIAIAVHPDYRNQGLGRYILKIASEDTQNHGLSYCSLTVDPLNGRGLHLYLSSGFKITKFKRDCYGPNVHRLFMLSSIKQNGNPALNRPDVVRVRTGDITGLEKTLNTDHYTGVDFIRGNDEYSNILVFIRI